LSSRQRLSLIVPSMSQRRCGRASPGAVAVPGSSVTAHIIQHGKERKILVFKKKRRKAYRRKRGHRQHFTAVQIKTINLGG